MIRYGREKGSRRSAAPKRLAFQEQPAFLADGLGLRLDDDDKIIGIATIGDSRLPPRGRECFLMPMPEELTGIKPQQSLPLGEVSQGPRSLSGETIWKGFTDRFA